MLALTMGAIYISEEHHCSVRRDPLKNFCI